MNIAPPPPGLTITPPVLSTLETPSPALVPLHASKTSAQKSATPAQLALVPHHVPVGNQPLSATTTTFTTNNVPERQPCNVTNQQATI